MSKCNCEKRYKLEVKIEKLRAKRDKLEEKVTMINKEITVLRRSSPDWAEPEKIDYASWDDDDSHYSRWP